jgi:site-specific DNA-methyltransferase (adenine-specific)
VEFILMLRKPGGYRQPTDEQREASKLTKEEYQEWFRQVWNGLMGESTRYHPAPFPEELAHRLVRMFSFVGDTVLDPFMGTGTTLLAAAKCGRNSIGVEIDPSYVKMAKAKLEKVGDYELRQCVRVLLRSRVKADVLIHPADIGFGGSHRLRTLPRGR